MTAPAGTAINGGDFVVPPALGSRRFRPYSDFLLHDVGTGDGIPVLPGEEYAGTADQIHTAPLWGLRTRNRLMHDGLSFTKQEAIARHGGQAAGVTARHQAIGAAQQQQVLDFLDSLQERREAPREIALVARAAPGHTARHFARSLMPRFGIAVLLCVATAASAQEPEPPKPTVRDAVDAGNYFFRKAFEERDTRAIADLYTEDGRVVAPGAEPAAGREAIAAFWTGAMQETKSVRLETLAVETDGDLAIEEGVAHLTANDDSVSSARYLVVWKRIGRRWHLHRDIWNAGPAAAAPAAEPATEPAAAEPPPGAP